MTSPNKIIDTHIHWWDLENNYYPWLNGNIHANGGANTPELAKTYLPKDYVAHSGNYNINGFVHIQADWDPTDIIGETKWLDSIAQTIPETPVRIVAFVDLKESHAEQMIQDHLAASKRVVGIRQMLNYLPNVPEYCWASEDLLQNPAWLENFALLERYNLSFDLMCFSNHMPAMAKLAQQYPNITILLEHVGMPTNTPEEMAVWQENLYELAKQTNVYCKIGGLGTMAPNWNGDFLDQVFTTALSAFGAERIIFASNFPTDSQFTTYDYVLDNIIAAAQNHLDKQQQDLFFYKNAERVYKIAD